MKTKPHHKRELLHESEGARHKIPGHRRPRLSRFKGGLTGRLKSASRPVPPTSEPPYVVTPVTPPSDVWFDPGKQPV